MPALHSHTHRQAPEVDNQAKACQRVCLSHPKKKKLKISFPLKNSKNANAQSDRKTFGQWVAQLNNDKGCRTHKIRTPVHNRLYKTLGFRWLNKPFCSASDFYRWIGKKPAIPNVSYSQPLKSFKVFKGFPIYTQLSAFIDYGY